MKKGFTLVELLFVMAIISILAGFAIANLKNSTKVATENSVKNDLKNAISLQNTYFAANQTYETVSGTADAQGLVIGDNGTKFTISKNNTISSYDKDCGDGTVGFYAKVSNSTLVAMLNDATPDVLNGVNNSGNAVALAESEPVVTNLTYSFDSCLDGVIKKGE
jgi:prepilin-type N-terminal cleavage/methylation domain-containing protein